MVTMPSPLRYYPGYKKIPNGLWYRQWQSTCQALKAPCSIPAARQVLTLRGTALEDTDLALSYNSLRSLADLPSCQCLEVGEQRVKQTVQAVSPGMEYKRCSLF